MTAADPHGSPRDLLRRTYSAWMRVPEYPDPIRVRWYWVYPDEVATEALDGYSSSDWDPYPHEAPPLGEDGVRRSPFRDWEDGSPPPWPVTVPTGLGVGLGTAARSGAHAASGSGTGLSLASCVAGYTREAAGSATGVALATAAVVYSRATEAEGEGAASGDSAVSHSRTQASTGSGTGLGVSDRLGVRVAVGVGTGSGLGTAASLSSRAQDATGIGSALADARSETSVYFTPDQVSGLYSWWKADAGVYKDAGVTLAASADTVQQWNDQSGAGRNLIQSTSTKRPQYLTNILNALPVVRFAGAHCLQLLSTVLGNFAILSVWRASGSPGIVYELGADVNSNDGILLYTTSGSTLLVRKGAVVSSRNDSGSWGVNNEYVPYLHYYGGFHAQHDGYFGDVPRMMASVVGNEPGSGNTTATLNVGSRNNAAALPLTGDLCELIVYTPAPSVVQCRGVMEYLREKWNR